MQKSKFDRNVCHVNVWGAGEREFWIYYTRLEYVEVFREDRLVLMEASDAASNRAVGLTLAEEGSILHDIKIPAAEICMCGSNEKERAQLSQEEYQKKLAEGLANAVLEVYTNKNTNDEVGET